MPMYGGFMVVGGGGLLGLMIEISPTPFKNVVFLLRRIKFFQLYCSNRNDCVNRDSGVHGWKNAKDYTNTSGIYEPNKFYNIILVNFWIFSICLLISSTLLSVFHIFLVVCDQ